MSFLAFLPVVEKILDRILPDKTKRDEARITILGMQQAGEFKELDSLVASDKNQSDVNLEEAKSESLFKSGWRPGFGWLGVIGMGYQIIVHPLVVWYCSVEGIPPPPALDVSDLITIVTGMLGLGAMRSHDKKHGVN